MFKKLKQAIGSIQKMFPLRAGSLNSFIALVEENKNPIEIKTTYEIETSQSMAALDVVSSTIVIGRRYLVQMLSKTREGQEIIFEVFCGFLSAGREYEGENELIEEADKQANKLIERISANWPKIKIIKA